MIGHPQYAALNQPFADLLATRRPLIAVHRGSGRGSIAENTLKGIHAALAEGADIVEIDVIASTDGDHFLFHDGYEPMHFGVAENIRTLSTAEIERLGYRWCFNDASQYPVERLRTVLDACPEVFFNVDRSWWWWPGLLDELAAHGVPAHLLLKSPVQDAPLAALSSHPTKFPYIPIVRTVEEVERVWADQAINMVGVELVASEPDHAFLDAGYVQSLRERGLAALMNGLNLSNRVPLYAGFDDEVSLLEHPDHGWGQMIARGADIIQTDWPGVLARYLERGSGQLP